jgi:high-affinity iron transporter
MFSATNDLLTLVAAGMAATGTRFLIQADLLPALRSPLWDTSAIIENGSLPGKTLHALIGYDARPSGTQMLVFALVLIGVGIASRMINRPRPAVQRKPAPQPGRNHVGA